MIRATVSSDVTFLWSVFVIDIASAFFANPNLAPGDQYVALPHPCLNIQSLEWGGSFVTDGAPAGRCNRFGPLW